MAEEYSEGGNKNAMKNIRINIGLLRNQNNPLAIQSQIQSDRKDFTQRISPSLIKNS
jgi:hypothetical protein